jgi:hypothetical protein
MLAGWAWGFVSKAGILRYRTLIDVAASVDVSRLWFEADAVLDDTRLAHVPGSRKPTVKAGEFLNTRALAPLSADEAEALKAIKERIITECADEVEAKRRAYKKERRPALIARGVSPEAADRALGNAVEKHVLSGDIPIQLDDGTIATIREILADRPAFHKKTCADPLEPEYGGGQNKAIIYTDGHPHIWSFAHGGIDYRLETDPADFWEPLDIDGAEDWPEPLDIFGDGDPTALLEVPSGALPTLIDRYSRDVAERMGVPVAFAAMGAVVTASGAIGGAIRLQPKARDTGWTVPPFIWGLLVEDPGGKKSPIMAEAMRPLDKLDERRAREDIPRRKEWEHRKSKARGKNAPEPGPRPRLRRSKFDSFTVEGLRDMLEENPKGGLVGADEVTGLIGGMDQYKAKGSGSDRADFLKLQDGQPRTFDRVGKSWRIECWGVSVLGGIQPKKMAEMARSLDPDGLLQRFIPIVGDNVRRAGVDRDPDHAAVEAYYAAIIGLAELPNEVANGSITLSPAAQLVRVRFDRRLDALLDMPRASAAWCGHLNKWPGSFARLLLVFHMLDHWQTAGGGSTEIQVSGETAERVWRFACFLLAHAIRFYETVIGLGASGDVARRAARAVLVIGKDTLSRRDLYESCREWRPGEPGASELYEAMRILTRHGWCKPMGVAAGSRGNPERWEINPYVRERFSERATAEAERRTAEHLRVAASVEARRAVLEGEK